MHFHILAHTTFASQVVDLQRYLNVTIYPCFNRYNFETVLEKIDFYLDINPFDEVDHITETAHQLGLPVFSFEGTNHDQTGKNQVFKNDQVDEMVKAVREYLETIER